MIVRDFNFSPSLELSLAIKITCFRSWRLVSLGHWWNALLTNGPWNFIGALRSIFYFLIISKVYFIPLRNFKYNWTQVQQNLQLRGPPSRVESRERQTQLKIFPWNCRVAVFDLQCVLHKKWQRIYIRLTGCVFIYNFKMCTKCMWWTLSPKKKKKVLGTEPVESIHDK